MGNIVTATVAIRGTRPFWQHKFGPEALPLEKQERTGVAGNDPEEWRRSCSITKTGQLYMDGTYVFGALREAGKYTKSGKASIQKSLVATLQVMDDRILLNRWFPSFPNGHEFDPLAVDPPVADPEQPVYLDVRGVVNPSTRGRNVRYRIAAGVGWECEFTLQWDKTIVSRSQMEAICIDAGKLVGLGNGRSIGMGRFDLVSFTLAE